MEPKLIYSSTLFKIIALQLPEGVAYYYADDTQLFLSFCPGNRSLQDAAVIAVEKCIQDIRALMIHNSLKINYPKTYFFIIGYRNMLPRIKISFVRVGGDKIQCCIDWVKNLGFVYDKHLLMNLKTIKVSRQLQAFRKLYLLKQIR